MLRYSLIETGDGIISIHRLVQKVVRDRLAAQRKHKKWAEKVICLVNDAFPVDSHDYSNWPACSRLLAHAIVVADRAEELEVVLDSASRLLNQSGLYLKCRAQFEEAEEIYRRALRIAEKVFRPDEAEVAPIVANIGVILQIKGDVEGALQLAKRALDISEMAHLPDYKQVAIYVKNVGQILKGTGDLDGALQYTQRALRIDEESCGTDHPEVATDVKNIGTILEDKGDLNGARLHFERAVRILQSKYGADHPHTKAAQNNLRELRAKIALDNLHTPPPE